ncbi:MAG: MlaD family protein [Bacteroidota bacterium]|nr:MlaD family protein [Bacteroidota bacterium]
MNLTNETKIGIAVFLAGIIFVVGVIFLKGIDFRSRDYKLTIYYNNVNGLTKGSPLTIGGLIIGKVEDMRLAGNTIAVGVAIDKGVLISKDSKAFIKSSSIMGGKQIAFTPGMTNETLQNGDTLTGSYEADLTELTSTLSPISTNVLGILERVNTTFDEPTRRNIQSTLLDISRAAKELQTMVRQQGGNIDYAVGNFSEFSKELTLFAKQLDTLATTQRGNIDESVKSIRVMARTMEESAGRFGEASKSLDNVFKKVERGEGTLGKLMNDEKLYQHLDSLVLNLNDLVKDVKLNPKRYVNVSVF